MKGRWHPSKCGTCGGTGRHLTGKLFGSEKCKTCNGTGKSGRK